MVRKQINNHNPFQNSRCIKDWKKRNACLWKTFIMSVYNNNKNLIIIIMLIMTNGGAIKFQLAKMRKHMCFTVYNQESATSVLLILTRWFYNKSQTKKKKQNHSSIGVLFTGLGLLRLRFLKCVFHRFCFFFF